MQQVREYLEKDPLKHNTRDFLRVTGQDFSGRSEDFCQWIRNRIDHELYQYGRTLAGPPGPETPVLDSHGRSAQSLNFASQDYLSLSSHPAVKDAAYAAIKDFGVHSAGSPMVIGQTQRSLDLIAALQEHLHMKYILIYPTGWAAGFGAITGLVRQYDYIVMDRLSHACLQQGAVAATTKILKHAHLDSIALQETLIDIRSKDANAAIMVVSEGLFSMDADTPDLKTMQEICREYKATFMVDVAHDLGALGPNGTGEIGAQGLTGQIDLVMGSFSKTFASNGGFVATNSEAIYEYLRMFSNSYMFSNALSPMQASTVHECLKIIRSKEGDQLRANLLNAAYAMRQRFAEYGIACFGKPSPIVPVPIGEESLSRLVYRDLRQKNVAAMVIEFPIVAVSSARLRLQLMASHTTDHVIRGADIIASSIRECRNTALP